MKLNNRLISIEKSLVFPAAGGIPGGNLVGPSVSTQWNYLPIKEENDLLILEEHLKNKDTFQSLVCISELQSVSSFLETCYMCY